MLVPLHVAYAYPYRCIRCVPIPSRLARPLRAALLRGRGRPACSRRGRRGIEVRGGAGWAVGLSDGLRAFRVPPAGGTEGAGGDEGARGLQGRRVAGDGVDVHSEVRRAVRVTLALGDARSSSVLGADAGAGRCCCWWYWVQTRCAVRAGACGR
jgi:hypothetical protein